MESNIKEKKHNLNYLVPKIWFILGLWLVLSLVGFYYTQFGSAFQPPNTRLINLAGRQRMLSQQISKLCLQLQQIQDTNEYQKKLREFRDAFQLLEKAHLGLQFGDQELYLPGQNNAEVKALFDKIDPLFYEIHQASKTILAFNQPPQDKETRQKLSTACQVILSKEADFLYIMNKITYAYDRESERKINYKYQVELVWLFAKLMLIALVTIFFVFPSVKQLRALFNRLSQEKNEQKNQLSTYKSDNQSITQDLHYLQSEIKQAKLNEDRYYQLLQKNNAGIFVHSLEKFIYCNPKTAQIFGYNDLELGRMSLLDLVHPTYQSLFKPENLQQIANIGLPFRQEVEIYSGKGEVIWIDLIINILKNKNSEVEFLGSFLEVTDKRLAANRLRDAYKIVEDNQMNLRELMLEISAQKINMERQAESLKAANLQIAISNKDLEDQRAKLAEALVQIKITEHKFRALFERSDDCFMIIENGYIVDCNDAALNLYKLKEKEEIYAGLESLSPPLQPDGKSSFSKAREMLLLAGRQGYHRFEWLAQKSSGEQFFIDVSLSSIQILDKKIFYVIIRDITAQKELENKLTQNEAMLAEAQEIAGLGHWEINFEDFTTRWSAQMYEQYGMDINMNNPPNPNNYFDFLHPDDRALVTTTIQKTKQKEAVELEHRIFKPNGEMRYLYSIAKGLFNNNGDWVGCYGTSLDITELKQTELALKERNKEIIDSINYAQKIQQAILPKDIDILRYFSEYFIYFKPKDIVSGDFYWIGYRNYRAVIASIDCTGHGIPGAFMSMIANDLLNEIVNKEGINSPNQILDELRIGIRRVLRQEETQNQDGMDISICSIDVLPEEYKDFLKYPKLEFSGASQPLFVIQNNELKTIKADKISIGGVSFFEKDQRFTRNVLDINTPTTIYMCSDGFKDQFDEHNKRRFSFNRFKELLLSIHQKPMAEQKQILDESLKLWMGNSEQVDDILVIGLRV